MIIDKTGPDGNVFVILGHAKNFQRQIETEFGEKNEILADVLANFRSMKYDEICSKLESTGLFTFSNGVDETEDFESWKGDSDGSVGCD